jgi:signal transduction histidine kinase
MNAPAAAAGPRNTDVTVRDLLSSLTALQALAMVMTESTSEDEVLDLAVSAVQSLSHQCRTEGVWLDGEWRSVESLRGRVQPRAGHEAELADLNAGGGPLHWPDVAWAWAFPLASRGGPTGFLIVGSPESPPQYEWSLLRTLAQQTGVALANARLLARERATRGQIADEQAALRRVAALVACSATPEEVFTAVATETARLRETDVSIMSRYDPDGTATVVGAWARNGPHPLPPGTRIQHGGQTVHTLVFDTGASARVDDYGNDPGTGGSIARRVGIDSAVAVPIHIDGRLWGIIGMASTRADPLREDTERWLAGFTQLVATAIAHAQSRVELRGVAEQQAALRRVATLVAEAASPDAVFASVAAEAAGVLNADVALLSRYEVDGAATVAGSWVKSDLDPPIGIAIGTRIEADDRDVHTLVFRSGRPARIDDYSETSGPAAGIARGWDTCSIAAAPISVDGSLWGAISVAFRRDERLPADTVDRLAAFTDLVATALANAEAQAALTASRARIVAAADATRQRIGRDLHDGAQQRLVSLTLQARAARTAGPTGVAEFAARLDQLVDGLTGAVEELRDIASGIHPAVLMKGGLPPAIRMLARRAGVPVRLDVDVDGRLPEPVELAGYYVVAEALTNAAKHAAATVIDVRVAVIAGALRVEVRDDGRGGADASRGSGLVGLADRVEALGGRIALQSPQGQGTSLSIALPLGTAGHD